MKEIIRRQKITAEKYSGGEKDSLFKMKPANKTRERLVEWLNTFPLYNRDCITFLKKEVAKIVELLLNAQKETGQVNQALKRLVPGTE